MTIRRSLFFRSGDVPCEPKKRLCAIAMSIDSRLRNLGLVVVGHAHGDNFYEIFASSSPRMIVLPDSAEASGIALLLAGAYAPPTVVFERINSIRRGLGRGMVAAVLDGLRAHPGAFHRLRVNDLSPVQADGRRWWEHIADTHDDFEWIITHDPDTSHREMRIT